LAEQRKGTELHKSLLSGDVDLAKSLIAKSEGIQVKDRGGITPLMIAAEMGQLEIARLLVDNGARLEARDDVQWTPLMYALRYGRAEVAVFLMEQGADVFEKDLAGWTTLMMVALEGNLDLVKLLVKKGLKINTMSRSFETAASVAFKKEHDDIGRYPIETGAKWQPSSPLDSPEAEAYYTDGKLLMVFADRHERSGDLDGALECYKRAAKFFENASPRLLKISEKFAKGEQMKCVRFYASSLNDPTIRGQIRPFEEYRLEYLEKSRRCQQYETVCQENVDRLSKLKTRA
jgi:Ankyrin repeats (3 copies)/Ankyrin repeat